MNQPTNFGANNRNLSLFSILATFFAFLLMGIKDCIDTLSNKELHRKLLLLSPKKNNCSMFAKNCYVLKFHKSVITIVRLVVYILHKELFSLEGPVKLTFSHRSGDVLLLCSQELCRGYVFICS
jgi:hypothetical protein